MSQSWENGELISVDRRDLSDLWRLEWSKEVGKQCQKEEEGSWDHDQGEHGGTNGEPKYASHQYLLKEVVALMENNFGSDTQSSI